MVESNPNDELPK